MLQKLKSMALSAVKNAPLPAGLVIGYLGHPIIKLAIDMVKGILG